MKKLFKKVFGFTAALVMAFGLASCNAVSAKTAEKIRVAEAKGEPWTYEEVIEKLGEAEDGKVVDTGDIGGLIGAPGKNGSMIYYSNADSYEEATELREAGKTVGKLTITIVSGKAIDAIYEELEPIEKEEN